MVFNGEQAVDHAEAQSRNFPGTCQLTVRTWFGAASAGDFDGDGDADAVDGWKSEPESAKHRGDRNPPRGRPVAWSGGRNGYGHRAISLGNGLIRSTDAGGVGVVATVDLGWVERNWGLHYEGWSETIDGQAIPHIEHSEPKPPRPEPTPEPRPDHGKGEHVEAALDALSDAKGKGERRELIEQAIDALKKISELKGHKPRH